LNGGCRLTVTVREARDADETAAAMDLRERVFCDEQGVDRNEELDRHEETATQMVVLDDGVVVATCRLRRLEGGCKLERMAVERRLRGRGVGARLLAEAESVALADGARRMILHAQIQARDFYAANGYEAEGEHFIEAKIEHVRMTKALSREHGG
jgi:predicted GNAT family N-acyltransferase